MSKQKIDGEIDAGWSSYWESPETVDATNSESGEAAVSIWPDEVDPEELTELQRTVVRTAVFNQELGTEAIAEKIGKEGGYVRATLKRVCPEWYNDTFKAKGSDGYDGNPFFDTIAQECGNCNTQIVLHIPMDSEPKLRCRCEEFSLRPVPKVWDKECTNG